MPWLQGTTYRGYHLSTYPKHPHHFRTSELFLTPEKRRAASPSYAKCQVLMC